MFRKLGLLVILFSLIAEANSIACSNVTKVETITTTADGQEITDVRYFEVSNSSRCAKTDKEMLVANKGLRSHGIRGKKLNYSKVTDFLATNYMGIIQNVYVGPAMDGKHGLNFNGFDSVLKFEYRFPAAVQSKEVLFVQCDIRIFSNDGYYNGAVSGCNYEGVDNVSLDTPDFTNLSFNLDEIADDISIKAISAAKVNAAQKKQ